MENHTMFVLREEVTHIRSNCQSNFEGGLPIVLALSCRCMQYGNRLITISNCHVYGMVGFNVALDTL